MTSVRRIGSFVLAGALTVGLAGCAGSDTSTASDGPTRSDMSQAQRKAALPDLQRDAETVANGMLERIGAGDLTADGDAWVDAHPLAEHHHLGKWTIKDESASTGFVTGTVCVEYRPAKGSEAVAMATANVQYMLAHGSSPADGRIGFVGTGLNVGC